MKATEIERKFPVRDNSWRACADDDPHVLQQAYLGRCDQSSIRVRLINGRSARLTIKFRMRGLAKEECEYEIPVEEARDLPLRAPGNVIEKTRYRVLHDRRNWDVDVFAGAYAGLTLAEIEMESEDERPSLPQGLGREVRGKKRYSNRAMAAALRKAPAAQGAAG